MYKLTDMKGVRECPEHSSTVVHALMAEHQGVDDYVQLRFETKSNGSEGMWVQITALGPDGQREGKVCNEATKDIGVDLGDLVAFHTDNIVRVMINDMPYPDPRKIASVRVVYH